MANPETRELEKQYNLLAGLIDARRPGPMSRARIFFAKARKPSLDMPIEAQENLLDENIYDATHDGLAMQHIVANLMEKHGGKTPPMLRESAFNEWEKSRGNWSPVDDNDNQQRQQYAKDERENPLQWLTRQAIGGASDIASGFATGYPNLASALSGGADLASETLTGKKIPYVEEAREYIPTAEKVSKKISDWTNGYTAPRGPMGAQVSEVLQTFGSLFGGNLIGPIQKGLGLVGFGAKAMSKAAGLKVLLPFSGTSMPLAKAAKAAIAGHLGAKTIEGFGGGPLPQTIGRLAFMHAAANPSTRAVLGKTAAEKYTNAKSLFADDKLDVRNVLARTTQLEDKLLRQGVPHREEMMAIINETKDALRKVAKTKTVNKVINKTSGATRKAQVTTYDMPVNDLIKLKQNLNKRYGWSETPNLQIGPDATIKATKSYLPKELREPLGALISEVKHGIARAGEKNPEAFKHFAEAEDITKGLANVSEVTRSFDKMWERPNTLGHHAPLTWGLIGLLKGGAESLKQATGLYDLMAKYPQAPKIVMNLWIAAEKESAPALIKNLSELDKLYRHSKKK
jgi:hypothetical protein